DDDDDGKNKRGKEKRKKCDFPKQVRPLIDPSGYIYEAVPSNRVEGATAVVYYAVTEGQDAMWDAENYDQVNPQITGADGMYQWDVPEGLWQVRVQKEGYQNNHSDWLPVPPPQLDVNIPLVRNKQPGVKSAHAYEDAVAVRFDSYMLPDSLTTKLITVTENGAAVAGTITLTDEEAAPDGATYASQIRFVPTKAFTATQVTLFISGQVVNYAGIEMDEPYEAILPIEREVKDLVADQTVRVMYGSTGVLHVKGTPAAAAAGKTVAVECASGFFASALQTTVVLNQNGEADVTVQGDLPGTEYVTFSMDDPELTATTRVKVVTQSAFVIDAPEASVPTGTEVDKATSVTLTCSTDGATIYYTLDGSDPLTSGTRILYDGTPIVINAETTLTAVAVVDGRGQSEVVTYHYTVKLGTAITDVNVSNITVTPVRVHDSFEVTGLDGTFSLSVYSVTGQMLMRHNQVTSGQKVNATALPTGLYLVEVNAGATYFTQRIIKE
ncbi:MAG: chitobiase/beta-hexosaminidase C-terminal domain-containing protein, partial [Paludibacteraceae bacterium]|nr:chitobiase/beta-hexosaminidase C-terminal domain-containing protein [Paludibacteraceae bacterium]